ncbi:class I SAM-dependent methyltransferase [Pikeienuella piscinae]|uniref:Class I SAM-dependent methyltransferase n=1 Tax=Pikeienuella piscinae TaxID=2748098 RepID=A0A7L5BU63_9RHOB|nr:methyltransferase domain-containing protein [Pikeienuella piscinae]QIE55112.1 class I SAM-dependent methyltransferase [Pikeienuella piscinae]
MARKADWSGALGEKWARRASVMERMLAPFGMAAMDALGDIEGRVALDLGCGGGASTFTLAGRGATAFGVDVSPDLIALAAERRARAKGPGRRVGFRCADAATAVFAAPVGALFSQFGAMFFDEPLPAYAHLRRAMAPGAPLAIACWRTVRENEWATAPLDAAKALLPPTPPPDPRAPGPFAWAKPEESFAPMLEAAGWRRVAWAPADAVVEFGAGMGGDKVEAATRFAMEIGPMASRLRDVSEGVRRKVESAVHAAMAKRAACDGRPQATAAAWIVTARA